MQTTSRNNKSLNYLIFCFALIILGCEDNSEFQKLTPFKDASVSSMSVGATQLSGFGFFDETDECDSPSEGALYAIKLTGDLQGCLYVFIDDFECSPSGTYREVGREHFIGTYKGESGSFWTTFRFEAKYEGCAEDGSYIGAEILGRCQHPIVDGSGDGVFEGATGRIDFKDDIEAGNYPFRGHIKF
jgi:hypothetical protein